MIGFINTIHCVLKTTYVFHKTTNPDFLNVCFDLNKETYIPYRKPSKTLLYIHLDLTPIVEKRHPQMIGQRIPDLSCDNAAFKKATSEYNQSSSIKKWLQTHH